MEDAKNYMRYMKRILIIGILTWMAFTALPAAASTPYFNALYWISG